MGGDRPTPAAPPPLGEGTASRILGLLTLREVRRFIARSGAVAMTVFFAVVYALVAMSEGGMLILARIGGGYSYFLIWSDPVDPQWWHYPGLLVVAPWGIVQLPFFGTVAMIAVAAGVGLGMSVAVLLTFALLRRRREGSAGPATLGSLSGLTPTLVALLAIGACCSTTAAAGAGIPVIAGLTGLSVAGLLFNDWFLSLFQVAIVAAALVAQEAILQAYGGLFGRPSATAVVLAPPAISRRMLAGVAFRAALLIGGLLWSLEMFVAWTSVSPATAPLAVWVEWLFVHQFVAAVAIAVAILPGPMVSALTESGGRRFRAMLRGVIGVAGAVVLVGVPPPLSAWGISGIGNELLGLLGAPASIGAVGTAVAGPALAVRWLLEMGLLGGFALAVAVRPSASIAPALWSAGRLRPAVPDPGPGREPGSVAGA